MKLIKGNFIGSSPNNELDIPENPYQIFLGRFATTDLISSTIIKILLPHLHAKSADEELENLFEVAITCWNIAVFSELNMPDYKLVVQQTMKEANFTKKDKELAKTFIEQKKKLLPGIFTFIHSFDMDENEKGHVHFIVEGKQLDDIVNKDHTDEDPAAEQTYRQFEPGYINRMALIVNLKQPFWEWLKASTPEGSQYHMANNHGSIYLIHEDYEETGVDKWLKKNFDTIFTEELFSWITDPDLWPKKRTYKMFTEFFEVAEQSMVYDLEKLPLFKE